MKAKVSGGGCGGGSGNADYFFAFSGLLSTEQNGLIPAAVKTSQVQVDQLDAYVQVAPTGQGVIVEFFDDAVSIGTVTIAAGAKSGTNALGAPVTIAANSVVTMTINQVGSTYQGKSLTGYARLV